MNNSKSYYCTKCEREISSVEKKEFKNLCEGCSKLDSSNQDIKRYISIGAAIIPIIAFSVWFLILLLVIIIENITQSVFFADWINFVNSYNFFIEPLQILLHPIVFSTLIATFLYGIITRGISIKNKVSFFTINIILGFLILIIYIFLIILLFS
jgi:hypothetical protein